MTQPLTAERIASARLSTHEAARYLGVSPFTLEHWRVAGRGPRFIRLGRRIVYDQRALDEYLERSTRSSTSEGKASPPPARA